MPRQVLVAPGAILPDPVKTNVETRALDSGFRDLWARQPDRHRELVQRDIPRQLHPVPEERPQRSADPADRVEIAQAIILRGRSNCASAGTRRSRQDAQAAQALMNEAMGRP